MDPITFLLLLALFLIPAYTFLQSYNKKRRMAAVIDKLPGPPSYPIVGSSLDIVSSPREKVWSIIRQRSKKYGPLYRSWYGNFPVVHVMKPEHLEVVLTDSSLEAKGPIVTFLRPWLGEGLLSSTGSKWHKHRKLITPAFHFKILENFQEVFNEKAKILVDKLLIDKANGEAFDIYPFVTHCALDIICETAMGVQINAMESIERTPYHEATYGVIRMAMIRSHQPLLQSDFVFNLSETGRRFYHYCKTLHDFTSAVIRERKESLKARKTEEINEDDGVFGKKKRRAFLDLLIEASKDGTLFSDEELKNEVDTFMFGGHDTTTTSIGWTLFLLGHHHDIQDKVAEEIETVFNGEDRPVTMNDLIELKYLERVIKESLRVYPSAPAVMRTMKHDIHIDGYTVPAGCAMMCSVYDAHRDERFFPDPEKFDPDRFLPENAKGRHPFAYIPFGAGPRNCIGQKFAMNEEKTVLATILRKYKVTSVQRPEEVAVIPEIILRPLHGMFLRLEPRKASS